MKRIVSIFLIIFLAGCQSSEAPAMEKMFIEDLNQLVDIIINEGLLVCDIDTIESLKEEALLEIKEDMSEKDFFLVLLPVANCGRVNLYYPQETMERLKNESVYIPIKIQTADEKMYLVDDETGRLPLDSEIISINKHPIQKIMEIIYSRLPIIEESLGAHYTEEEIRSQMDMNFSSSLAFIIDSAEYEITLNENGQLKEYTIPAINRSELEAWLFPALDEEMKAYLKNSEDMGTIKKNYIRKELTNTRFMVSYEDRSR